MNAPVLTDRPGTVHASALTATWATGAVLVLAVLPPFVPAPLAAALHGAFAFVCHQLPDRTPHLAGAPLAVCHRCLGIYLALPLGALALRLLAPHAAALRRRLPLWLGAAAAVPAVDWGLGVAGVWANTPASRLLTGAVLGLAAGLALALSLARARRAARRSTA